MDKKNKHISRDKIFFKSDFFVFSLISSLILLVISIVFYSRYFESKYRLEYLNENNLYSELTEALYNVIIVFIMVPFLCVLFIIYLNIKRWCNLKLVQ